MRQARKSALSCHDTEICNLRWKWGVVVPALGTSVFIVPGQHVNNRDEHLTVLNRIVLSVVNELWGKHPSQVFSFQGKPTSRMLNGA